MSALSALKRSDYISEIPQDKFDIAIIGGGITGAGIALDAASRGMKTVLIEKYDFAGGTSSRSTKLIHGGLRYLKQMEFGLVRQVGRERSIIYRLAPHLVHPIDMLLPIVKNGSLGRTTTSLALFIYDFLAKVKKRDQYKMLGPKQVTEAEPLLKKEGLIGGALYKEYRTDDARLTISILKTAADYGAYCVNYLKAEGFLYESGKITGITCRDLLADKTCTISAKKIINAAGPWVDDVRRKDEQVKGKKLHLTKGIHIVVDRKRIPVNHALYFDVPDDNRMIFVIPRNEIVYIGTTDTDYTGDKNNITITKEDISYLLNAVNASFPSVHLTPVDILSGWAGLRPLIHKEGKSPNELSRKDEIFTSSSGLLSIAGGKLTGYRRMAEKIVNRIALEFVRKYNLHFPACRTENIMLHGAISGMPVDEFIERRAGEAKQVGFTTEKVRILVERYGADVEQIIENAFHFYHQIPDPEERILKAELKYCIENEMVTGISDFLIQRTGMLFFEREKAIAQYETIGKLLEELLPLKQQELTDQLLFFRERMRAVEFR